jgi:hypothetical protein
MSDVELEDVTPAPRGGELKYVKLQDLKAGETYKGIYVRSFENKKSKYKQNTYVIFSSDHELLGLNGTAELDGYFEVIEPGRFVVVTFMGSSTYTDKETKEEKTRHNGKVQCGKENQYTADLRALSKQAAPEKQEKAAAPKSSGKLEGLFKGTPGAGIPH